MVNQALLVIVAGKNIDLRKKNINHHEPLWLAESESEIFIPQTQQVVTETPRRQQVVESCRYADVRQGCHQTSVASGFFRGTSAGSPGIFHGIFKNQGEIMESTGNGGVALIFPSTKCKKWKNVLKPMRNSMVFFWEKLCISSEFFKAHGKNHGRGPNQS